MEYLAGLPFSHRVGTPPGGLSPADDLLIVHANPRDVMDKLDPAASEAELRAIIGDTRAPAIAFDHIHICYVRRVDDVLLVDVSAVGNPKDDDLHCKYGVLTWDEDDRAWRAATRKLDYPLAATAAPDPRQRPPRTREDATEADLGVILRSIQYREGSDLPTLGGHIAS